MIIKKALSISCSLFLCALASTGCTTAVFTAKGFERPVCLSKITGADTSITYNDVDEFLTTIGDSRLVMLISGPAAESQEAKTQLENMFTNQVHEGEGQYIDSTRAIVNLMIYTSTSHYNTIVGLLGWYESKSVDIRGRIIEVKK